VTKTTISNPLCVALDSSDRARIADVAEATLGYIGMYKIGLTTFVSFGRDLVAELRVRLPVFLDLKLHDIPAQVEGAVRAVAALGASYTTVHAAGGTDMIRAAVEAADNVKVLAVTVLTSLDDTSLARMQLPPTSELVTHLAEIAVEAGAHGLVCSAHDVADLRARFGSVEDGGPLLVVPGIRTLAAVDDQRRTATAARALSAGADVVVVGRPITQAPDPGAAARDMLRSMQS
jgi:orotidine-5'-phosphate decarboxylase